VLVLYVLIIMTLVLSLWTFIVYSYRLIASCSSLVTGSLFCFLVSLFIISALGQERSAYIFFKDTALHD
jgi:hypothetical protein